MSKDKEADREIISYVFSAFSDEILTQEMRECMEEVVVFLINWHQKMKATHPTIIADHTLYRVVCGILAFVPEDIVSKKEFLQHVFNETLEEYTALLNAASSSKYAEDMKRYPLFKPLVGPEAQGGAMLVSYYSMASDGGSVVGKSNSKETVLSKILSLRYDHLYRSWRSNGKAANDARHHKEVDPQLPFHQRQILQRQARLL